jgi:hypothetical protein
MYPCNDRAAALEMLDAIFVGVDCRDWVRVQSAFAEQVLLDYGEPETLSPVQIVARWKPLLESLDRTQHTISHQFVSTRGDMARCGSTFRAIHFLKDAPRGNTWTLEGRYEHELARSQGLWRVRAMKMIPGASLGNAAIFEDARAVQRRTPSRARLVCTLG